MTITLSFSSSSKVWDDISWIHGIEDAGYRGWEIVADGNYRLDSPERVRIIDEAITSTNLSITVHAPYSDLNLATLNYPIWRESIRQICTCIVQASAWTDRVTFHPGYMSPVGKMMPERSWQHQKDALQEIGRVAEDHGVLACLENMISIKEFLCRDPGEIFGMTEGIAGIGVTIDFGHANTTGLVNEFLPYIPHASHMHIHDNFGEHDDHLAIGKGNIDWTLVGPAIARGYSGTLVVEGRSIDEGSASLRVVREWLA